MSNRKGHKGPKPLPELKFPGRLLVVRTVAEVHAALTELQSCPEYSEGIGLDMEWDPDTSSEANNPIATLQMATDSVCVVFMLIHMGNIITEDMKNLLLDTSIVKIAHSFDLMDRAKLAKQYKIHPEPIQDVGTIARQLGIQRPGLASLCKSHLMHQMSKQDRMTKWSSDQLSQSQLVYAATDAWATRKLYFILAERQRLNEEKKAANTQKRQDMDDHKQEKYQKRLESHVKAQE